MAKFRFIITDIIAGCVKGTNEEQIARETAESEDFFVADTERGVWLLGSVRGDEEEIEEIELPDEEEGPIDYPPES